MRWDKSQNSKEKEGQAKSRIDGGARKGIVQAIRQLADGVRGAFKRTSYETKEDYRQLFLESDISQARVVILLLAVTIALFTIGDYMILSLTPIFFGLVALRLLLIAYSGFQFMYMNQVKNYRSFDTSTFIYLLTIVAAVLLVNSTRPQNFIPHIIVIDMAVFVFYLVIPNRFIFQALPSLIFSAGEVLIIMVTFGSFDMPALITALSSLAFANIVAALSSLQLHSYRWRIFQNVMDRKDTDRLVAIGQTAGMIGHDIRNPLQAIVSELYIAKGAIANTPHLEDKTLALESIDLIEEQTDYISKIISDLQDYARPIKPDIKEVDLAKLVVSVFQTVRVPDKIVLKIDVKGFPKIKTDPTLIRRALTNLINNAIQAMPDGGSLELCAVKTEDRAVITVTDTGKGIPEEIKPKLFTPLVTTKAKGQGLGLAVVKRLVEALGGSITFESEVGKGTTFTINLPVEK
jgi:signal transduction histidine kinase